MEKRFDNKVLKQLDQATEPSQNYTHYILLISIHDSYNERLQSSDLKKICGN